MTKTDIRNLIAQYQALNLERLELDRRSAKLKVQADTVLDQLTAAGAQAGTYGPYILDVTHKQVPRCTDWPGFHAFVREHGAFELMHKRLTDSAVMERINAGDYVPGIVTDDKVSYKVTAK